MPEVDIEKIVREVLDRLRAEAPTENKELTTESASGRLTLSEPLVTLATLAGRMTGLKQLVVRSGAILTPAARDLLRERRVEVVFQSGAARSAGMTGPAGGARLMLALAETNYEASALARNLKGEGLELEQLATTGLEATLDELASGAVRGGWRGWLLTGEAPAAVCLANRKPGLRAAAAANVAEVRAALRSAGANLLVTDPAGKSYWELWRIGRAFARGGGECPAWLRDLLK